MTYSNNTLAIMVSSCAEDTGVSVDRLQKQILEECKDGMTEESATEYVCELAYEGEFDDEDNS